VNNNKRVTNGVLAAALTLLLLLVPVASHADYRVSVLLSNDSAPYQKALEGFQSHLADNGVQASYEVMKAGGDKKTAARVAAQVQDMEATVILCIGTLACQSVQQLSPRVPVVAALVLSPESFSSMANSTGVFLTFLPQTQLQWLKKLFPRYRRIGVIYNPEQNRELIRTATQTAASLGLELVAEPIETPRELPTALEGLLRKIDILWAMPDKMVLSPKTAKEILLTSFRNRIPVIGASTPWVKGGALYALDWDYRDIGAQSAEMALKIIKGMPIKTIPAAEPRSVTYTLNLKTARHMKLDIPADMTRDAKHVYQ